MTRFRWPALVAGVLALGALALPAASMHLALPTGATAPAGSPARASYDLTTEGFGAGFNGRLAVVVHSDSAQRTAAAAQQLLGALNRTSGVVAAAPGGASPDGTTVLLAVIPTTAPDATATEDLVRHIRADLAPRAGAEVSVTGATAVGIDVSRKLADALPVYLLVVVGLSVVLLLVVFRSLLVPLTAALGFLLTVGATFGVTVAVFQQGHLDHLVGLDRSGPLVSFLPVLLIGILFGLAMDYQVFLVSRMREDHVHGAAPREAVVAGLGHGGRVVTAAAVIMTSVFGGFVLVEDPTIKSIGFALAVGVLLDAFVVRMTLVPAVMALLGRSAWYLPRWLDRALPRLDIEGEQLRRRLAPAATPEPEPVPA